MQDSTDVLMSGKPTDQNQNHFENETDIFIETSGGSPELKVRLAQLRLNILNLQLELSNREAWKIYSQQTRRRSFDDTAIVISHSKIG